LEFSVISNCVSPLERGYSTASSPAVPGIAINVTAAEFYASFANIFRLSDGSKISAPKKEKTESLRYMQELMYMIGKSSNMALVKRSLNVNL
jgi:hypothetical protein